jgi:membrane fusion protein (multidrug efflux system)
MEEETKQKKKRKFIVIGIVGAIALVAGAIYFINGSKYETSDNAQLDGNIIPIRSGITAYVSAIRFNDNQTVKKGDTLIVFDAEELTAKVLQAEAAVDNARANLLSTQNRASASVENANASRETSESNQQAIVEAKLKVDKAQSDFNRMTELNKVKAATAEQLENAKSILQLAQSEYAKAIHQQQSSASSSSGLRSQSKAEQNQIDLARAQIKQREAELAVAVKQLSYATVLAPYNGVVTKRTVQQGQYIAAGQSLCVVVDNEHFWISANFKETQLRNMKIGSPVTIKLDAFPDLELTGMVESYSGATGAKFSLLPPDNATGNFIKIVQRFPSRISIDNFPKERTAEIFPGLSAFVKVKVK